VLRLLADENFPGKAVQSLLDRGHDVSWIRRDAPGASDEQVLARSLNEGRILLTFDKDFGALVFQAGLSASAGVVLFRLTPRSPWYLAEMAVKALESRTDWEGHFAVVEDSRIRMTKLPAGP